MASATGSQEEKQQTVMLYILTQECKSLDVMWDKTGVEHEELEDSIQKLGLERDPDFQKIMQEFMQKAMQAQMAQGGMGMGGMPPMGGPPMGGMGGPMGGMGMF